MVCVCVSACVRAPCVRRRSWIIRLLPLRTHAAVGASACSHCGHTPQWEHPLAPTADARRSGSIRLGIGLRAADVHAPATAAVVQGAFTVMTQLRGMLCRRSTRSLPSLSTNQKPSAFTCTPTLATHDQIPRTSMLQLTDKHHAQRCAALHAFETGVANQS